MSIKRKHFVVRFCSVNWLHKLSRKNAFIKPMTQSVDMRSVWMLMKQMSRRLARSAQAKHWHGACFFLLKPRLTTVLWQLRDWVLKTQVVFSFVTWFDGSIFFFFNFFFFCDLIEKKFHLHKHRHTVLFINQKLTDTSLEQLKWRFRVDFSFLRCKNNDFNSKTFVFFFCWISLFVFILILGLHQLYNQWNFFLYWKMVYAGSHGIL